MKTYTTAEIILPFKKIIFPKKIKFASKYCGQKWKIREFENET